MVAVGLHERVQTRYYEGGFKSDTFAALTRQVAMELDLFVHRNAD